MRNRLPFFLTLLLSAVTVLAFNIQADAQWRDDGRYDRKERRQVRRDGRQERVVIITPRSQIYRGSVYYENDRYYETNRYGTIAQIARLNGYQDGTREGADDARDGDRYDPFSEGAYKEGDGGYKSSYGSKRTYEQIYRQGFLRGYRESFDRYFGGYIEGGRNW